MLLRIHNEDYKLAIHLNTKQYNQQAFSSFLNPTSTENQHVHRVWILGTFVNLV